MWIIIVIIIMMMMMIIIIYDYGLRRPSIRYDPLLSRSVVVNNTDGLCAALLRKEHR